MRRQRGTARTNNGSFIGPDDARRLEMNGQALQRPADAAAFMPQITPAEKFYLAAEYRRLYPEQAATWGAASKELDELAAQQSFRGERGAAVEELRGCRIRLWSKPTR